MKALDHAENEKILDLSEQIGKIDVHEPLCRRDPVQARRFDDRFRNILKSRQIDQKRCPCDPGKSRQDQTVQHRFRPVIPRQRFLDQVERHQKGIDQPVGRGRKDDPRPQEIGDDTGDQRRQYEEETEKSADFLERTVMQQFRQKYSEQVPQYHPAQSQDQRVLEGIPEAGIREQRYKIFKVVPIRKRAVPVCKRIYDRLDRGIITEYQKKRKPGQDP